MKNLIILFTLIFTTQFATAQLHSYGSSIMEDTKSMSQGANNSFSIEMAGINQDMAEDVWKKYAKNYDAKSKRDRKSKEYFADDAEIRDISDNPVDIYTSFSQEDSITTATFWFNLGGAYLSSELHSDKIQAAQAFVNAYAFDVGKVQAKEELKLEEKAQKELEKQLVKLEKDNKEYHKRIEDAKALIAEMEKNIETNVKAQEKKNMEINVQKDVVKMKEENLSKFN